VEVFENPRALPRAYRTARALPEPASLRAALRLLASERFDPRRHALVDAPPRALRPRPGEAVAPDAGEVEIALYEPERVVLRTRGERAALVVLGDAWYPGWEATLDGARVPLLRANLNFRGVAVPAGSHEVEMRYRPASLRRGLLLAALGAAAGGAALGVARRWQRAGA
jgi:hypothetical protein